MPNFLEKPDETTRAWPFLVAGLLHVAVFAAFRPHVVPPGAAPKEATIDVVVDEPASASSDEQHAEQGSAEATPAAAIAATRRESAGSHPDDSIAPPADSALVLPQDTAPTGGQEPWSFRTTQGGVDLGIGDKSGGLARSMFANGQLGLPKEPAQREPVGPPPPIDPGVKMTQELDASDVARGFGRGGPVAQAIESVVRDATPSEGGATFEVAISKTGAIAVHVLEATGRPQDWQALTGAIEALVKSKAKTIRFPEKVQGLRFGIRVEAEDRRPGGDAKKPSNMFAPPTTAQPSVRDDGATEVGNERRPQLPQGGSFAIENLGTHASRIVHAKELYEQRF